jgi:hypothetical protein
MVWTIAALIGTTAVALFLGFGPGYQAGKLEVLEKDNE